MWQSPVARAIVAVAERGRGVVVSTTKSQAVVIPSICNSVAGTVDCPAGLGCSGGGQRRGMMGTRQVSKTKKESARVAKKQAGAKKDGLEDRVKAMVAFLDERPAPQPKLSEEEHRRNFEIGRRYNQMMAKEHNTRMADYSMKIRLRDDAIANLPELLQHAARQKDWNPPPTNRRMATYTPPIEGYNPKDYIKKEDKQTYGVTFDDDDDDDGDGYDYDEDE